MLKRSAKLIIQRDNDKATITVVNKTGHHLPGDGLRAAILEVTFNSEVKYHIFTAKIGGDGLSLEVDNRLKLKQSKDFYFVVPNNQPIKPNYFIDCYHIKIKQSGLRS